MSDEQSPTSSNRMEDVDDSIQAYPYGNGSPSAARQSYNLDPDLEQHEAAKWVPPVTNVLPNCNIGSSSADSGSSPPVSSLPSYPTNASATLNPLDPTRVTNGLGLSRDWFYPHFSTFPPPRHNVGHEHNAPNGVPIGGQSNIFVGSNTSQEFGTMPPRCHDLPLGWVNPGGVQPLQTPSVNDSQRPEPRIPPQRFNGRTNWGLKPLQMAPYLPRTTKANGPGDGENARLSSDTTFSPIEGGGDWVSEGSSAMVSPPGSDTAFSTEDRYTSDREHQYDTNDEESVFGASSSRSAVAHNFRRKSFAYPGESSTRYRSLHKRNAHSFSSNMIASHSLPLQSPGADTAQRHFEPRFLVPERPTHTYPGRPSSDPQTTASQPCSSPNANLASYPFVQSGPTYPFDGDHGRLIAGPSQPVYSNYMGRTSIAVQSTNGRSLAASVADDIFNGPVQPISTPSQSAVSSNAINSFANLVARSELYPTLDSPCIFRVRNGLPSHAEACFRHSRPDDKWQLVFEKLLNVLSVDIASLAQYDDVEIKTLLHSRCEQRLCAVERQGTKRGVTSITCLVNDCNQKFDSHNISRNYTHHLMKMHWNLRSFICHHTNCGASFSWPDDRTRHEKGPRHVISEPHS